MSLYDTMSSVLNEQINTREIKPTSIEELNDVQNILTTKTDDKNLFDKFECLKQSTTSLSDPEDLKKRLNQSISLWNDLLNNIIYHVNEKNKSNFDQIRTLLLKVYSDTSKTNLFTNDHEFARETFFKYLDLINTSDIQQFLITLSPATLADAIRESNIYIIIFALSSMVKYITFIDDDIDEKYHSLLNSMRIHIEQKLQTPKTEQNTKTIHHRLLSLLWNLSDRTVTVPSLLRVGFGKSVIEWLNYPTLTDSERRPMVSIVHNLSRHDQGADELNKYDAIEIINHMQQLDSVRQSKMFLLNTMSLALLSTPDQIKANPTETKTVLNQLLQITINASTAKNYRYNDFHISEPLAVLVKLFVDDSTFDYVMNQAETDPPSNPTSTIKLFSDLLILFRPNPSEINRLNQFTFIALINILWSISFHEKYHDILKQNTELIETIKNVAKTDKEIIIEEYVPRSMQNVKKAADGILFNLGLEISSVSTSIAPITTIRQKPLVMLSYSHANNDFCDKILELLDQKGDSFDIWIDKRCCKSSADVWEAIAKGIKNAQLIICIVSNEYIASKACRQEIIYAKDRLNKRFLPVYLEKPDVSEWLDIRLAEFKYVRFQNIHLKLDERKTGEFLSTVMECLFPGHSTSSKVEIKHHHTPPSHHEPIKKEIPTSQTILTAVRMIGTTDDTTNKSVLNWTENDIHQWFTKHNISSEIRDLYQFKTGAQMLTYAECFKDGWQKQYERYAVRHTQQYPGKELPEHEFALFVSALKQLATDSNVHNNSTNQQLTNGNVPVVTDNAQKTCFCTLL